MCMYTKKLSASTIWCRIDYCWFEVYNFKLVIQILLLDIGEVTNIGRCNT